MRTLVAYVPVLHEGYRKFFTKYDGPKEMYLFGPDITKEFEWLRKEIRELDVHLMQNAIESAGIFERVEILNKKNIASIKKRSVLIAPDEDVSRSLVKKYFSGSKIIYEPVFLRWDKHNSVAQFDVSPDTKVSRTEFDKKIMARALKESEKSSDIWRRVGAAVIKNKKIVLIGHNRHMPSAHTPWVNGDPRNNFHKGDHIELSSAIHAEAALISEAAKRGVRLEGADMYATTFPCPPCAKLIANAGIKNLYYAGGYSMLDGETIFKSAGVKLILVK